MEEKLIERLLQLDGQELAARRHFMLRGVCDDYTVFTPGRNKLTSSVLKEDVFLPADKNMELEKLPRYIRIPEHSHDFVECAYVVCGVIIHKVNGFVHEQHEGCLSVIPPGAIHELQAEDDDTLCLTVKVRSKVFLSLLNPEIPEFSTPKAYFCGKDEFVRRVLLFLWEQQDRGALYCDEIMQALLDALLSYLLQNFRDESQLLTVSQGADPKMDRIARFVIENYRTVTLRSLAAEFHYNESYLSSMIRRQTGASFTEALREFRLFRARELLLTTGMGLNEICDEIGYHDTSRFIKDFKKRFGTTPGKFRRGM